MFPGASRAAAEAARTAALSEPPAAVQLPDKQSQRAAAIGQTVAYLADGADCVHASNLAFPFYQAIGIAVCGSDLCLVTLTVDENAPSNWGTQRESSAAAEASSPSEAQVRISCGDWLRYLPSSAADDKPEGLLLLARIVLVPAASLCSVNSLATNLARVLPCNLTLDSSSAVLLLGSGGYGAVFFASVAERLPSSTTGSLVRRDVAIKVPLHTLSEKHPRGQAAAVHKEAAVMARLRQPDLPRSRELAAPALSVLSELLHDSEPAAAYFECTWPGSVATLVGNSDCALVLAPVGKPLQARLMEFTGAAARTAYLWQLLPCMLRALVHCHARGVEHNDVRLQNFIVVSDNAGAAAVNPSRHAAGGRSAAAHAAGSTADRDRRSCSPDVPWIGANASTGSASERAVLIDFGTASHIADDSAAAAAAQKDFGAADVAALVRLFRLAARADWPFVSDDAEAEAPSSDAPLALRLIRESLGACAAPGKDAGVLTAAGAASHPASATPAASSAAGLGVAAAAAAAELEVAADLAGAVGPLPAAAAAAVPVRRRSRR